jgi:hypothetical protein
LKIRKAPLLAKYARNGAPFLFNSNEDLRR